jgi:excisionase family DNA binding protein
MAHQRKPSPTSTTDDVATRLRLPRMLKVRDLVKHYSLGRSKIYKLMAEGELRALRAGGLLMFRLEDVERYFDSLPVADFNGPLPKKRQARAEAGNR